MTTSTQGDLLDLIHRADVVHDVMPDFALACGGTVLDLPPGHGITFGRYPVTCPDCLATPDVHALKRAMQRRQA